MRGDPARVFSLIPGGAPGRLRRDFHEPEPLIVSRALGSRLWDSEGREYLDFHMAFGAVALGHGDEDVVGAVARQARELVLHGAGSSLVEAEFASLLVSLTPGADMAVFTVTGGEAVMAALRLARAYTRRSLVVKFEGNYHGWHDYSLYNVSTPLSEGKRPETLGIPGPVASTVEVLPYNDPYELERFMERRGGEVAAIILEPVAHSMGVVPGDRDFVRACREACDSHGCLLIFDEIITFVRDSLKTMQPVYGVRADLVTVGKAIANGMPVAALLGPEEYMKLLEGRVAISGTYASHPLSMAAGIATIKKALSLRLDEELRTRASMLARVVEDAMQDSGLKGVVSSYGGALSIHIGLDEPPRNLAQALKADLKAYRRIAGLLRRRGVLVNPNPLKRLHLAYAHTAMEIEESYQAFLESFRDAKRPS